MVLRTGLVCGKFKSITTRKQVSYPVDPSGRNFFFFFKLSVVFNTPRIMPLGQRGGGW